MKRPSLQSQITFLYYRDLARATRFYENVLQLELCEDQGDARIYRVAEKAFVGIVDGAKGHCQAQETNAVLVTFVTENVEDWYAYLRDCGVKLLTEIKQPEGFPVQCFFFEDPEGYQYEVQRFLNPETVRRFQC